MASRRFSACRALLFAPLALAALPMAGDDEGAAAYRVHVMEAIGGHTQAFFDILKGDVQHKAHLSVHADALADLAAFTATLFPEGSGGADTDSLPAIWENPEDFAMKASAFEQAAANLAEVVAADGAAGPAAQRLGQACKGCHDDYRAE